MGDQNQLALQTMYDQPIPPIPIRTLSPKDQPSIKTCSASEAEHVTSDQPEMTSPTITPQPPSIPSPQPSSPQREPNLIQSQFENEVVYEIQSGTDYII